MMFSELHLQEMATLGQRAFEMNVRDRLQHADDGKYVAIDVDTADYEVDDRDIVAVDRLKLRKPAAGIWLMRAGSPATNRIPRVLQTARLS